MYKPRFDSKPNLKLGALLLLGVFGFFSIDRADSKTLQWTQAQVSNLHLVLQDKTNVEDLFFGPDGTVTATEGIMNGPLCGPVFSWKIGDGKLHIFGEGQFSEYLVLLKQDSSGIVVQRIIGKTSSSVRYVIVKK